MVLLVGSDNLLDGTLVDAVVGLAREHWVGHCRANALSTLVHKHISCHTDSTCRIDHIVYDDDVAALNLADSGHRAYDVGLCTLLVRDDDWCFEQLCVGACSLCATRI